MKIRQMAFLAVFLAAIFVSCNNAKETQAQEHFKASETFEIPEHIREEILQIGLTPEDLLTDEQFNLIVAISNIIKASIVLENNQFINTSTPEDFESLGISIYHYYILKEDVVGMNKAILCEKFGVSAEEFYNEFMRSINEFFERNEERIARMQL